MNWDLFQFCVQRPSGEITMQTLLYKMKRSLLCSSPTSLAINTTYKRHTNREFYAKYYSKYYEYTQPHKYDGAGVNGRKISKFLSAFILKKATETSDKDILFFVVLQVFRNIRIKKKNCRFPEKQLIFLGYIFCRSNLHHRT